MSVDTAGLAALRADYLGRCREWSDLGRHLPTLRSTVREYDAPVVIELGVRDGVSTSAFLLGAAEAGGQVWSVDITPGKTSDWWPSLDFWHPIIGSDVDPVVLAQLPEVADVVFVDTSHHYEHTLQELRTYLPRVRPGGVVLLHDTELDMPPDWAGDPFPVRRAIEAFCAETDMAWKNHPGDSGLGVIQVWE